MKQISILYHAVICCTSYGYICECQVAWYMDGFEIVSRPGPKASHHGTCARAAWRAINHGCPRLWLIPVYISYYTYHDIVCTQRNPRSHAISTHIRMNCCRADRWKQLQSLRPGKQRSREAGKQSSHLARHSTLQPRSGRTRFHLDCLPSQPQKLGHGTP